MSEKLDTAAISQIISHLEKGVRGFEIGMILGICPRRVKPIQALWTMGYYDKKYPCTCRSKGLQR